MCCISKLDLVIPAIKLDIFQLVGGDFAFVSVFNFFFFPVSKHQVSSSETPSSRIHNETSLTGGRHQGDNIHLLCTSFFKCDMNYISFFLSTGKSSHPATVQTAVVLCSALKDRVTCLL